MLGVSTGRRHVVEKGLARSAWPNPPASAWNALRGGNRRRPFIAWSCSHEYGASLVRIRHWVLSAVAGTIGCTGMRTVEPALFIPQRNPNTVAVWTAPDKMTIVSQPRMQGDSLTGLVFGGPWTMALKDITRVEARAPDPKRTVLLVTGAAASMVGFALLVGSSSGKSGGGLTAGLNCSSDYSAGPASGLAPCDAGSR